MKRLMFYIIFVVAVSPAINAVVNFSGNMENENEKAVFSVFIDNNGIKWFGTMNGVSRYDGVEWIYYSTDDYLKGGEVYDICAANSSHGPEMWFATDYGATVAAYNIDGITSATTYTTDNGLPDNLTNSVAIDSGHVKYVGISTGVSYFKDGVWDTITYSSFPESIPKGNINDLDTYDNLLYVATSEGIGRFSMEIDGITGASRWTSEYGMTPLSGNIISVYIDNEGNQWFGTDAGAEKHTGLSAKENWSVYTVKDGLVNNYVNVIAVDDDSTVWFGTNGGVSKYVDNTWTNYTIEDGLVSDTVYDIDFDKDGSVWFATNRGISRLYNDEFTEIITASHKIVNISKSFSAKAFPENNVIKLFYSPVSSDDIVLRLFSISGKLIQKTEISSYHFDSDHFSWHISSLQQGIYIIHLSQGGYSASTKILLKNP